MICWFNTTIKSIINCMISHSVWVFLEWELKQWVLSSYEWHMGWFNHLSLKRLCCHSAVCLEFCPVLSVLSVCLPSITIRFSLSNPIRHRALHLHSRSTVTYRHGLTVNTSRSDRRLGLNYNYVVQGDTCRFMFRLALKNMTDQPGGRTQILLHPFHPPQMSCMNLSLQLASSHHHS